MSTALCRVVWASAATALLSSGALAQARYDGPVTLLIPVSSGSGVETSFRVVAEAAAKHLGQAIIPENRPGGGGRLAMSALATARKDGSVIAQATEGSAVVIPLSSSDWSFEPDKDFVPVIHTSGTYVALAAHPSSKFRDAKGLVEYAKANPGKLKVSGVTLGAPGHIAFGLMMQNYGVDLTVVHYKSIQQALADVLNGTIDALFSTTVLKPHIDSGKLVAIAVTSPKRWSYYPSVPTFLESGFPELTTGQWYGIIAPPGIPPDVVARLNQAFRAAVNEADVRAKHEGFGMDLAGSTPAEFSRLIRASRERLGPVIRKLGLTQ